MGGMIGLSALSFTAPLALLGLLALPALWWLLRATPPQPVRTFFPPVEILRKLEQPEQTPDKTPWWLLLLRLLLLAALILAFAGPQWRAGNAIALPGASDDPILLVIESDWASAHNWTQRIQQAERIADAAAQQGRPIALLAVPQPTSTAPFPSDGAAAASQLDDLQPHPARLDRLAVAERVSEYLQTDAWTNPAIIWMTSGLAEPTPSDDNARAPAWIEPLLQMGNLAIIPGASPELALTLDGGRDGPAALIHTVRSDPQTEPSFPTDFRARSVIAYDAAGRQLATVPLTNAEGVTAERIAFDLPSDLRNDIARIAAQPVLHAGEVLLIDDRNERRQVAIISGDRADQAQPLLSAATYLQRALQPLADVRAPRTGDGNSEVRRAIANGADVIILAGSLSLVPGTVADLSPWIESGGVLIRFASAGLASNPDPLLPVPLRAVDRQFGGALTWEQPQNIAPFRASSPFAGLTVPSEIVIERQVLSEPGSALATNTYAELSDATPLVTGQHRGLGHLILFHVTAETSWSNLPLSGLFVDMLGRLIELAVPNTSRARNAERTGALAVDDTTARQGEAQALNPRQTLNAFGTLGGVPSFAETLVLAAGVEPLATVGTPPGFYGPPSSPFALNLFDGDPYLVAARPDLLRESGAGLLVIDEHEGTDLRTGLFTLAILLALTDAAIVLALSGGLLRGRVASSASVGFLACVLVVVDPAGTVAQTNEADALQKIIAASNETRFAYVLTGESDIDRRSREGISGISRILTQRTAFEPAPPFGIDPATDELSVYPLLYWPMPDTPMAVPEALVERIDAYMKNGGTILFDTRDEASDAFSNALTPQTANLRALLGALDIPPLEPVPDDHVLTKSFYLIDAYPGRYPNGPLWVERLPDSPDDVDRPARGGDGVSAIMITSNDFASAWALSNDGRPLYPTSPPNPLQREFAYRTGVNIAMYVMTGNYKADQVHIPALLERLIQ
ncbi:MAG: DUF4159 domain-containing protein [Pseudomonadota bacterium]